MKTFFKLPSKIFVLFLLSLVSAQLFAQTKIKEINSSDPALVRSQIDEIVKSANQTLALFSSEIESRGKSVLSDFKAELSVSSLLPGLPNPVGSMELNLEGNIVDDDERFDGKRLSGRIQFFRSYHKKDETAFVLGARLSVNGLDYLKVVADRAALNDKDFTKREERVVNALVSAQSFSDLELKWKEEVPGILGQREKQIWENHGILGSNNKEFRLRLNFFSEASLNSLPEISKIAKALRIEKLASAAIVLILSEEFVDLEISASGAQSQTNWDLNTTDVLEYSQKYEAKELVRHALIGATVIPEIVRILNGTGFHNSILLAANGKTPLPPKVSKIQTQYLEENKTLSDIRFVIGSNTKSANNLLLRFESSNLDLIPHENIVVRGTGEERFLSITPAANRTGETDITIIVTDASDSTLETRETFHVFVSGQDFEIKPTKMGSVVRAPVLSTFAVTAGSFNGKVTNSKLESVYDEKGKMVRALISPTELPIGQYVAIKVGETREGKPIVKELAYFGLEFLELRDLAAKAKVQNRPLTLTLDIFDKVVGFK